MKRKTARAGLLSGLTVLLSSASFALAAPITVGSKLDREGQLLGQMIILSLKNAGYSVVDKTKLGDTGVNRKALIDGRIDIYPEYSGNAIFMFPSAKITNKQAANRSVVVSLANSADKNNGVTWLTPADANNTWSIAIPKSLADSKNIRSVKDLATYLKAGGSFKLAGSAEFFRRSDTMPAFESAYGFSLKDSQKLIIANATPERTEAMAAKGTDGVNASMAYGTDGSLSALKLVALTDPLNAQVVYAPVPVVRTSVLKANPNIEGILNRVFASLSQETLQSLNAKVGLEGQAIPEVARNYLKSKGLIK